jgi:hypothetical protein
MLGLCAGWTDGCMLETVSSAGWLHASSRFCIQMDHFTCTSCWNTLVYPGIMSLRDAMLWPVMSAPDVPTTVSVGTVTDLRLVLHHSRLRLLQLQAACRRCKRCAAWIHPWRHNCPTGTRARCTAGLLQYHNMSATALFNC